MIYFDNWRIWPLKEVMGRQYDNLSDRLDVWGYVPPGWRWEALIGCCGKLNIIHLEEERGVPGVVLTRDMLGGAGFYEVQLRGTRGDEVRHTNKISVQVPASLSGDVAWPTVPTEFTQLEARVNQKADEVDQKADEVEKAVVTTSLSGEGAPGETLPGRLGQDYLDTETGDKWYLAAIDGERYIWRPYGADEIPDDELLAVLLAADVLPCVADGGGAVLTDEQSAILMM